MSRADSELWTAKMTASFNGLDVDGDGSITAADLHAQADRLAAGFGHVAGTPAYDSAHAVATAWTADMIKSLDKDGDEQISLAEWLAYFSDASDEDLTAWCDQWAAGVCALGDADDDGQITDTEYIAFAVASGASPEDAVAGFAAIDAASTGTGYVTKDEFSRFMFEYTTATGETTGNELLGAAT